ncbi:MAG: DUF3592 domain-containing protein [Planctomycetaceae bacterium]|nr:DUF3592 domain-containing protein [Planctomycetaceae bacterium]
METPYILSIIAAILFAAGIIPAIIGVMWRQRIRDFIQLAEQVEGTVVELVESRGGKGGRPTYAPVVEYTDHFGQRREHRAKIGASWQRFSVGDKVQILYERNDPDSTKINHWLDLYFGPGICLFLGIDAVFFAIVLFVVAQFIV